MKKIRKIKLSCYFIVLNLLSFKVTAQDEDPGFPTENPAAPIDNWVVPLAIIGIGIAYWFFRKRIQVK